MKEEEQIIAIAKACGFKRGGFGWFYPDGHSEAGLPNYLNDLNVIREARKILTPKQHFYYIGKLAIITKAYEAMCNSESFVYTILNASAKEHAEAFLRTLKLWTTENEKVQRVSGLKYLKQLFGLTNKAVRDIVL